MTQALLAEKRVIRQQSCWEKTISVDLSYPYKIAKSPKNTNIIALIMKKTDTAIIPPIVISGLMIFLAAIIFAGCEDNPTEVEDYQPEAVLSAYLYSGEPVENVFLERVAPIDQYYEFGANGIAGAQIIIFPLGNPAAGDTLHLTHTGGGVYHPLGFETLIPQSGVIYRIEARKPSEDLYLWAETEVPGEFTLTVSPYTLTDGAIPYYLDWNDVHISLDWTSSVSAGGYIFSSVCLTNPDSLQYLDPDEEENEENDEPGIQEIEFIGAGASGLEIPWLMFNWVGWHWIQIQAISDAGYEYMLSNFNTPGNNPISNIHGGFGIFAGVATQSFVVYVERAD